MILTSERQILGDGFTLLEHFKDRTPNLPAPISIVGDQVEAISEHIESTTSS